MLQTLIILLQQIHWQRRFSYSWKQTTTVLFCSKCLGVFGRRILCILSPASQRSLHRNLNHWTNQNDDTRLDLKGTTSSSSYCKCWLMRQIPVFLFTAFNWTSTKACPSCRDMIAPRWLLEERLTWFPWHLETSKTTQWCEASYVPTWKQLDATCSTPSSTCQSQAVEERL